MSNRQEILTPVGRLVLGSLYEAQTEDYLGNPLTIKSGANAGQPRVDYYFGIAIEKGTEQHWTQTVWGRKIYETAVKGFPNKQYEHPSFAWKITDGDSAIPNKAGNKPCDREGHRGHWILNFSSGFPPKIFTEQGTKTFAQKDAVKLGDYIEVYGSVADNGSPQQPGVFLNHQLVNFVAYGEAIILGPDPKSVGFTGVAPAGSSKTPQSTAFSPTLQPEVQPAPLGTPPAPYPQILNVPPAPPAQRVMTPKAAGHTHEWFTGQGWTDALLIQHGYMLPS